MRCNLRLIVLGLLFAMEGVGFLGPCGTLQFHGLQTALNSMNCESLHLEEVVPQVEATLWRFHQVPNGTQKDHMGSYFQDFCSL